MRQLNNCSFLIEKYFWSEFQKLFTAGKVLVLCSIFDFSKKFRFLFKIWVRRYNKRQNIGYNRTIFAVPKAPLKMCIHFYPLCILPNRQECMVSSRGGGVVGYQNFRERSTHKWRRVRIFFVIFRKNCFIELEWSSLQPSFIKLEWVKIISILGVCSLLFVSDSVSKFSKNSKIYSAENIDKVSELQWKKTIFLLMITI